MKEENYGTTLLNQTFNADVIANVLFDDAMAGFSEAKAWSF